MSRVAGISPKEWISSLATQLGQENADLLCKAYNVTPDMDHNLFTTSALRWIGDAIFDGSLPVPCMFLSTNKHSTHPRLVQIPLHTHLEENIQLRLRRPQSLSFSSSLPAASSLGRQVLCLQNTAISLPFAASQGHIDATRAALDRCRKWNSAVE